MSVIEPQQDEFISELEKIGTEFFKDETPPEETPQEPETPETPDDPEEAPQPEVVSDDPPEPPAGDLYDLDGRQLSKSDIASLVEFDDFLNTNDAFKAHVAQFFTPPSGGAEQVPPPAAAPPQFSLPDDFDPEDPTVKALSPVLQWQYEQIQSQAADLAQVKKQLATRTNADNEAIVNRVAADFAVRHDLNESQVQAVRDAAGRLGVLPSLLSGVDPVTNKPSRPDTMTAVDRAMEIAYNQFPEFRERELARVATKQAEDKKRKAKLGAISGSGSGGQRTPPPEDDSRDAKLAYVASLMKGEGS